jgi:putative pyruvate formate lyase activating enzyme
MKNLESCNICPRSCSVNRYESVGYCRAEMDVRVSKAFLHMWEEPCISGTRGSGTVFFSNCNLGCVFCQNHHISHGGHGKNIGIQRLSDIFIELQNKGAHNINLVTPTHYIPQIKEAIISSKKRGLILPIVYNSNAYENVESLRDLEGLIDIYLPDIKYFSDKYSVKYSNAPGYFECAKDAVLEMLRQVGVPEFENGILKKGLMIRHLMLPGLLFDSKKIVDWVSDNLPREVYLNVMCQYTPMNKAFEYPELSKKLNKGHYESLIDYAQAQGIENGYFQDFDSAREDYVPNFDLEGI